MVTDLGTALNERLAARMAEAFPLPNVAPWRIWLSDRLMAMADRLLRESQ